MRLVVNPRIVQVLGDSFRRSNSISGVVGTMRVFTDDKSLRAIDKIQQFRRGIIHDENHCYDLQIAGVYISKNVQKAGKARFEISAYLKRVAL